MRIKTKKRSGFLMMEVAVSLFVFALLLTCLGMTLNHFGKINKYLLAKQQCTAAAQGMLDSIAVRGEKISAEDIQRLWPKHGGNCGKRMRNSRSLYRVQKSFTH